MEWLESPTGDGMYWYLDADFHIPERCEVTNFGGAEENVTVTIDGYNHVLGHLREDTPYFYGPVDMDPPEVSDELLMILEEADKARYDDDLEAE